MPPTTNRILDHARALAWRDDLRQRGCKLVLTNGCYDLLHPGHVTLLELARALGDALLVAINSDASVRRLKGPERPIVPGTERAELLAAMAAVDAVTLFDEDTPLSLIELLLPDVLVKGSDWGEDAVVGRKAVERAGGRVVRLPLLAGFSTSAIVSAARTGTSILGAVR